MIFEKLVAIEPVSMVPEGVEELHQYAKEVILFDDIPADEEAIINRICDADAVLVSYTSRITQTVFEYCPNIKYVGMCCSLYSEASANVDIAYAKAHGITVKGIRDYGDRGVVEYAVCELVRFLHGYDRPMWSDMPVEITDLKVGVIGLGVSGAMIAEAMKFMGAEVSYYSRTRKPEKEKEGYVYQALDDLLENSDVVFACLNKNVILLGEKQFEKLGSHKILFNTSIGPAHDPAALAHWLEQEDNYFCCDTAGALGDESLKERSNVFCVDASAGRTKQAFGLLTKKVLENIREYMESEA